jgi:hypothetical protein
MNKKNARHKNPREILGITGLSIRETGEPGKGARFEITVPPGYFHIEDQTG